MRKQQQPNAETRAAMQDARVGRVAKAVDLADLLALLDVPDNGPHLSIAGLAADRVAPEVYSPERKAEFLLTNAVDSADYAAARRRVREEFGLDPDAVPHRPSPDGSASGTAPAVDVDG